MTIITISVETKKPHRPVVINLLCCVQDKYKKIIIIRQSPFSLSSIFLFAFQTVRSRCSHVVYSSRTFSIFSHFPFSSFRARSSCELYPVNRSSLLVTVCNLTKGQRERKSERERERRSATPPSCALVTRNPNSVHSRVCAYTRERETFNTRLRSRCIWCAATAMQWLVFSCVQREWRITICRNTLYGTLCG